MTGYISKPGIILKIISYLIMIQIITFAIGFLIASMPTVSDVCGKNGDISSIGLARLLVVVCSVINTVKSILTDTVKLSILIIFDIVILLFGFLNEEGMINLSRLLKGGGG